MKLVGERVTLTDIGIEDAAQVVPAYNGDEQFNLMRDGKPTIDLEAVRADMIETKGMPGGTVWRIDDRAGTLIGVATTALVPPPHGAWIALLVIIAGFQRQSYGAATAALLEEYLFADPDIAQIGLAVQSQNTGALAFWEKRGYKRGLHRKEFGNEIDTLRLLRPTTM